MSVARLWDTFGSQLTALAVVLFSLEDCALTPPWGRLTFVIGNRLYLGEGKSNVGASRAGTGISEATKEA